MMFDDKCPPLGNDVWLKIPTLGQWCLMTNPHPRVVMFDEKSVPLGNDV